MNQFNINQLKGKTIVIEKKLDINALNALIKLGCKVLYVERKNPSCLIK